MATHTTPVASVDCTEDTGTKRSTKFINSNTQSLFLLLLCQSLQLALDEHVIL